MLGENSKNYLFPNVEFSITFFSTNNVHIVNYVNHVNHVNQRSSRASERAISSRVFEQS